MLACLFYEFLDLDRTSTTSSLQQSRTFFKLENNLLAKKTPLVFLEQKKQAITKEHFYNDLANTPLLNKGQAHDGYSLHCHMKIQIEDLVDCLKVVFPNYCYCVIRAQVTPRSRWTG